VIAPASSCSSFLLTPTQLFAPHYTPPIINCGFRVQFAGEEAKYIQLFKRFRQEFENGFGSKCDFIGPAEDVSQFV
jgi:hypothetical protein